MLKSMNLINGQGRAISAACPTELWSKQPVVTTPDYQHSFGTVNGM